MSIAAWQHRAPFQRYTGKRHSLFVRDAPPMGARLLAQNICVRLLKSKQRAGLDEDAIDTMLVLTTIPRLIGLAERRI